MVVYDTLDHHNPHDFLFLHIQVDLILIGRVQKLAIDMTDGFIRDRAKVKNDMTENLRNKSWLHVTGLCMT